MHSQHSREFSPESGKHLPVRASSQFPRAFVNLAHLYVKLRRQDVSMAVSRV